MTEKFATLDFQAPFCCAQLPQGILHKTYSKVKRENEYFRNSSELSKDCLSENGKRTNKTKQAWMKLLRAQRGKLQHLFIKNIFPWWSPVTDLTWAWFDKRSHLQKASNVLPNSILTCEQRKIQEFYMSKPTYFGPSSFLVFLTKFLLHFLQEMLQLPLLWRP